MADDSVDSDEMRNDDRIALQLANRLDHAAWFHRPARVDEWLLQDVQILVNAGGRGTLRELSGRAGRVASEMARAARGPGRAADSERVARAPAAEQAPDVLASGILRRPRQRSR